MGFVIERVLADSLYGESGAVIRCLEKLQLPYIVVIRANHGVLIATGQRVRYNRWHAYDQPLSEHPTERRHLREIIFGIIAQSGTTKSLKAALQTPTEPIAGSL